MERRGEGWRRTEEEENKRLYKVKKRMGKPRGSGSAHTTTAALEGAAARGKVTSLVPRH